VGDVPPELTAGLKTTLGLRRAVETGTYRGGGAKALAGIFEDVVTIELSEDLYRSAAVELSGCRNVTRVLGDSRAELGSLAAEGVPTLYWLDGHWSGGATAGATHECPVLGELEAIGDGHDDDCVLIDDARLFAAAPPPPHDPTHWPTLIEVLDALRSRRPGHYVTVLHDLVIAVPPPAKPAVDAFAYRPAGEAQRRSVSHRLRKVAARLAERVRRARVERHVMTS
jgi:hypothetical protein